MMALSDHTPGPWTIESTGYRDQQTILDANGDCATVKANARLIAAAPSLLKALQDMVAGSYEGFAHNEGQATVERAQQAVEKATK